jgi:hypothetical protein
MKGNFVQTMSNALKGWPLQTRVCAEGMIDIIKKSRVSQRVSVNLGLTKSLALINAHFSIRFGMF